LTSDKQSSRDVASFVGTGAGWLMAPEDPRIRRPAAE
jgi:hypothetical protein